MNALAQMRPSRRAVKRVPVQRSRPGGPTGAMQTPGRPGKRAHLDRRCRLAALRATPASRTAIHLAHDPPHPDVNRAGLRLVEREEENAIGDLPPDPRHAAQRPQRLGVGRPAQRLEVEHASGDQTRRFQQVWCPKTSAASRSSASVADARRSGDGKVCSTTSRSSSSRASGWPQR